ncbi:MAG: two-component regulator propeller domain-containing protein [Bacteroidia bacterium]
MYTAVRFCVFLCLFICSFTAYAQIPFISDKSLGSATDFTIENWTSENGLPQNSVVSMLQTRDGFLWLSTTNGLLRFDGKTFRTYNSSNTKGLEGTSFPVLFESRLGILWLLNLNGQLLKLEQGEFQEVILKGEEKAVFKALCENTEGNLIAATADNKIYELLNGSFRLILTLPVSTGKIDQLCSDNGSLYCSTVRSLYAFKDHKVTVVAGIKDSVFTLMRNTGHSGLWIYNNYRFYKLKDGKASYVPVPNALEGPIRLNDYCIDSQNRLWITCSKGLAMVNGKTYRFYGIEEGLSSELTSVLCTDRENNIWVGTSEAGLNKMKHKTFLNLTKKDGLIADPTGAILFMHDNSLLVSNYCEGLNCIDKSVIKSFTDEHIGCIWALLEDKESSLWAGVYGDGVYRLKEGKWQHFPYTKEYLPGNVVFSLFQDREGTIWIGTNNGICVWKNEQFSPVLKDAITFPVTHFMQDSKGQIWICTSEGLGVIRNGKLKLFTTASGLMNNKVRYIYEDKDGIYWIATYGGGLHRLKDDKIVAFRAIPGMIDDYTSCVVEDESGNLWISSNRGIYRANRNELNKYADGKNPYFITSYYGQEEGMKNSECNGGFQPSGLKSADGRIWFPTLVGVVLADTRPGSESGWKPDVFIEQADADDKPVDLHGPLVEIKNGIKKIVVHYTAPYFGGEHKLFFQYMLEGRDKDWGPPTESRTAEFIDLQPGDYAFHVRVYGSPNPEGKRLALSIPFPFWRTWTFYVSLYTGIGLLVFLYIRLRIRRIRRREKEKTRMARVYAELELKALQGQMNPHFTFNCLNTIKYFIATDNKVSANKYLGKFSRLLRLFLEQSTSSYITLASELEILSLYVELEQLRMDKEFEFHLEVPPDLDTTEVDIPAMLLQPFMENAIHHGLLNSDRKRSLYLRIRMEGDMLVLEVEDNGIGRANSAALRCTPSSTHKSMGIQNTTDRIETINYIKNTSIEMRVTDLHDTAGQASGTRVTILIPFIPNLHKK